MSLNLIKQEAIQEEPPAEEFFDDLSELIRRAESIIQENRERNRSRRPEVSETLREQAIAMLRESSPILELNEISDNIAFPVEEVPPVAANNCTNDDSDDDVIFVNSVQQPPLVVDLSTPDAAQPKPRRRRRLQYYSDDVEEICIECTHENSTDDLNGRTTNNSNSCRNVSGDVAINCVICLDTCRKPTATLCGHIFCEKCITTAIKTTHKCPMCKRKLTLKSIHPLYFN